MFVKCEDSRRATSSADSAGAAGDPVVGCWAVTDAARIRVARVDDISGAPSLEGRQ